MIGTRMIAALLGAALGLTVTGGAFAQEAVDPAAPGGGNNVDGAYVVADDDGNPNVTGEGESLDLGDVQTGGAGAPPIIYGENAYIPDIDILRDLALTSIAGGGEDETPAAAPTPIETGGVRPESVVETSSDDGSATELGEAPAPAPVAAPEPAPAPEPPLPPAPTPSATGSCAAYASWFDAQVAYEDAGGTGADPALVASLDPDGDGFACEELMLTS